MFQRRSQTVRVPLPAAFWFPGLQSSLRCLAFCFLMPASSIGQAPTPLRLQQRALDLQVSLDYPRERLEGIARLTLENAGNAPVRRVPLLLNRLMLFRTVTDGSGQALRFSERVVRFADDPKRQVDFAEVALPRPLDPGSRTELVVHYDGNLVGYVETGSLYVRDRIDTSFTILRTDAYAFPVIGWPDWRLNRGAPTAPFAFHLAITVPEGLVAVTGGRRLAERRANGRVTWEYASTEAVPFLNIAVAPYVAVGQRGIEAYVFPSDSLAARGVIAKAEQALDSLSRWFGPLDSAPRVTVIEIPPGYGSQASLSAGIIIDAAAFRDASRLHELYHELSHFWNPRDTATPSPRVTEGLASLLEQRLAAALDGRTGLDSLLEARVARLRARAVTDSALRQVPMRAYGSADRTGLAYPVGMLLFHSLQQCLGTAAFDALWGDYLSKTRKTGGSDEDFAAFAIRQTGNPAVRELFETWLFTTRWIERLSAGEPLATLRRGCG